MTVGGILMVNGFRDFLANYAERKTADDPLRQGLAILGAACPDQWLTSSDWALRVAHLGLIQSVIPPGDRNSGPGRVRGIGVVLSAHEEESFIAVTADDKPLLLRLQKERSRRGGGEPRPYYCFTVEHQEVEHKNRPNVTKPKPR